MGACAHCRPLAAVFLLAVWIPGCQPQTAGDRTPTADVRQGTPQKGSSQEELKAPDQQHAAGSGITITWQETGENRAIRKVLDVNAEAGELDAIIQSGALKEARGTFYREGKARAKFAAPQVIAIRDKQTVVARGGVTVNSIDPPGVALRADQITWNAQTHRIIARGSVRLSHTPKGATSPIAYGNVPQATANTELQVITVP